MLISNSYRLKRKSLKKNIRGLSGGIYEERITMFPHAESQHTGEALILDIEQRKNITVGKEL